MGRVVVIGFDGATFDVITPMLEQGELPTFNRVMQQGAYGPLVSTPEMISPAAWTSLATGVNPGKHGIFDFMDLVPGSLKLRYGNATMRDAEPVWNMVSQNGGKASVLNMPMTYPADAVNGYFISGWNAPGTESPGFTHPAGLIQELEAQYGPFALFPDVKKYAIAGELDAAKRNIFEDIEQKRRISLEIMQRDDWDLFISVFIQSDQAQHYFWHCHAPDHPRHGEPGAASYGEVIRDVYRRFDDILAEHMALLGPEDSLLLVSDHGFGNNHRSVCYMPQWPFASGLATRVGRQDAGVMDQMLGRGKAAMRSALAAVYGQLNMRLSVRAKSFLNRRLKGLRDKVESTWRFSDYDWSKSQVFFHYYPRLNLQGREPEGIVPPEAYDETLDQVIALLHECRDPATGKPVVERVLKGREVYHGPHTHRGPDVIIHWRPEAVLSGLLCTNLQGGDVVIDREFVADHRTGHHRPEGVFVLCGPGVPAGRELEPAQIVDVAPTILQLLGYGVPEYMDGRALQARFQEQPAAAAQPAAAQPEAKSQVATDQEYSEEDEAVMMQRLKDLGYL